MKKENTESLFFKDLTHEQHFEAVLESIGILKGMGIEETVRPHYNSIIGYIVDAGVSESHILNTRTVGVVSRGVSDIWNYGSGTGVLSEFFFQSLAQLVYKSRLK